MLYAFHLLQSSCKRPSMWWSWTVCLWNAHLKGAESQSLHDWAGLQGLHMGNQTPFQALSSSSSGAADVQGFSKAPPSNLHVRTANLLTFCLSLTHAAHTKSALAHTHTQRARLMQNRHWQRSVHKTDFEHGNLFPYFLSLMSPSAHFSAEATRFLFGSLPFHSVQQLGEIQHVPADSGNSFIQADHWRISKHKLEPNGNSENVVDDSMGCLEFGDDGFCCK